MKKQEFNKEISSLTELLRSKFTSSLTKRIELDNGFFTEAQHFANETLDFSYYSELERKWDIAKCSKIKFLACQNNYLNELRVHKDLRYLLINSAQNYLQPQKHDKEKIHPLKNVTYITPLEGQDTYNVPSEQPQPPSPPSWKSFYRWIQTEIIENNDLRIKLKPTQQANYPKVSENALNRFVNSLEATLDNDSFFHLFPNYDDNKSFEELFNLNSIFCGKKSDKKRIGEVSYRDLEKLFYNWKESLNTSPRNQREQVNSETKIRKSVVSKATSDKVRNILLIGRTGSGKSTLANVLVNKNEEFEEVFKESAKSVSETKSIKTEKFTIDLSNDGKEKIDYQIIDTIGFGDTKLSNKEVLQLLQDLVPIIGDDGLNQVLFVTDGRFTEKEIETYKLLETVIFDKEVVDFTTIIRARFPEFEDREECDEDKKSLREENEEMFRILKSSKIIYVDNPPLIGRSLTKNKEIREESRKRLLTYLATCQNIYYPANLAEFKQRIDDYQSKSEQLEKELVEKEQAVKEQEERFQNDVRATQTKQQIDLEHSRRKFQQKLKTAKNGYEYKLKYTQEQLENKYQEQLKNSQQRYEREQNEAEKRRQAEVNRIESEFKNRKVNVGEAICSRGHGNVTAYNKYGNRPDPDDFEDGIHYVYCPSCGKNDYNCEVRNAKTYNFEEWCRMRNQSYARELEQMNRQIQEQQRRKQETLARIEKERKERNALFEKELERERQLQAQIINKQKKLDEEMLNSNNLTSERRINSSGQEKINRLNRELAEKKRALEEFRRESQAKKNSSQRQMEAYMEQLLK